MSYIYLDHNATTPVYPEVLEAMLPFFKENFGNPSSIHQIGQTSRKVIEEARAQLASFINAEDPGEIIFTSGGTESNNMAIKGALSAGLSKGKRIVSSAIEHSSVRQVLQYLSEKDKADTVIVPVQPNGIVQLKDVQDATTPDTVLVSIMAANNEVGTLQPIQEISQICKNKKIPFHSDAVQLSGKAPIDVQAMGVDMLSLSGHKFGAPKGVGLLYVRKGTRLSGLIQGGHQEKNRRGGTENVAGIVGMGKAAQIVQSHMNTEILRLKDIRDYFEREMTKIPYVSVNGDRDRRTCNTSNLCIEYTDSSALLMALDLKGIGCSTGSACAAGSPDPSHVLLAMGLPQHKAHASLRFSFGSSTQKTDIEKAVVILSETLARLRDTHPLWKQTANG